MRTHITRLTLMEFVVLLPIIGVSCTIPIQCRRAMEADDCRVAAEFYAESRRELTAIADERSLDGRIPSGASQHGLPGTESEPQARALRFFDKGEEDRIADSNMTADEQRRFWARFAVASARHGYQRAQIHTNASHPLTLVGALAGLLPTYCVIGLLVWLLARVRRKGSRKTPSTGPATGFHTVP